MSQDDHTLPRLVEHTETVLKRRLGTREWTLTTVTQDKPPGVVALVLTLPAIFYLVQPPPGTPPHFLGGGNGQTTPVAVYLDVDTAQLQDMRPDHLAQCASLVAEYLMLAARDAGALPGYGGNPQRAGGNFV